MIVYSDSDAECVQALALPHLLLLLVLVEHAQRTIYHVVHRADARDVHIAMGGKAALLHQVARTSRDIGGEVRQINVLPRVQQERLGRLPTKYQ